MRNFILYILSIDATLFFNLSTYNSCSLPSGDQFTIKMRKESAVVHSPEDHSTPCPIPQDRDNG